MYAPNGDETLYITELLFGNQDSQISFLFLNLDGTRPVYHKKKIILFSEIQEAEMALHYADCGAEILSTIPDKIANEVNFAQAIEDLKKVVEKTEDTIRNSGNFLDCLQFLMDIYFDILDEKADIPPSNPSATKQLKTPVSPAEIPDRFYRILFCASQFFMFDTEVTLFTQETGYEPEDLFSAFKYALGDLMTHAWFLKKMD
ncbi:MAG: hypothetical protein Q4D98_13940 [Planctomycetia bacterium]|nr:hypothetical protein [Planctomycetia bacterium]